MTIYEIKRRVVNAPHFFDRKSMKFFGQTLKSFRVRKMQDGRYRLYAPTYDSSGKYMGISERIFNPKTNEFERG